MDESHPSSPQPTLSLLDAIALIIGIVVGAGIYKTPSQVAADVSSEGIFLLLWLAGGAVSLVGALCYAELATAYPHVGGEYHYLARAFGRELAFLFAWARLSVMQTGSIVLLAFIVGDYFSELLVLGQYSSSIYAAVTLAGLTALNAMGIEPGKWGQNWLSAAKLLGLVLVIAVGLAVPLPCVRALPLESPPLSGSGSAAIFVLLTYGGWSEAAYLSAEVRDAERNLVKALVLSLSAITVIFLLVNVAYLRGLGLEGMARSPAVAADLMRRAWGETGVQLLSSLVAISALGSMQGTIFTGARTNSAWGQDVKLLSFLGRWHPRHHTPLNALLVQGTMALGLIVLATLTRQGFTAAVEYTAPVFWFFLLLVGISLFVLRAKEPDIPRAFRVPFYPVTPLLFCLSCLFLLGASLVKVRLGAIAGVGVLLAGVPLLIVVRRNERATSSSEEQSERESFFVR